MKMMRIGNVCIEGLIVNSYVEARKTAKKIEREEFCVAGIVQLKNKKWLVSGQFEKLRKIGIPMGV